MAKHWLCRYLSSSVGKKQVMGVSGLLLCGFLITHLLGNLLILVGPSAFNNYAHKLITNPLIIPMEIGLLGLILFHVILGMTLTIQNKEAREVPYLLKKRNGRGATFASSTMPYTGIITLAFLIAHIIQFRFGPKYEFNEAGVVMRDLHRLVVEVFSNPAIVTWYVFCMIALGIHVSHGFASAFQSIGFNHPKYTPILKKCSILYAIVITVGFSLIPLWILCKGGN